MATIYFNPTGNLASGYWCHLVASKLVYNPQHAHISSALGFQTPVASGALCSMAMGNASIVTGNLPLFARRGFCNGAFHKL